MKVRRVASLLVLPLLALLAWACGPFETASGGSGTETLGGGKVTGRVLYADGSAASGAAVAARPAGYLHDTSRAGDTAFAPAARAGASGTFTLDSLPPGDWLLEFRDARGRAAVAEARVEEGKWADIGPAVLRETGTLQGVLGRVPGEEAPAFVQILGLARAARAGEGGAYRFEGLPPGRFRVRALATRPHWVYRDTVTVVIPAGGEVRAEPIEPAPAHEDLSAWAASRTLSLSTAAAGVFGDVEDFPLLVRLDSATFDFARGGRRDLRFTDAAGAPLPFAVERWDSAGRRAEAWVLLPRVAGNRADNRIVMHWGRPGAAERSDPRTVFASFAGTWLFPDADPAGAGTFRDASPSSADGTGSVLPGSRDGLAGEGRAFGGGQSVRAPGTAGMRTTGELTLSAWVRVGPGGGGGPVAGLTGSYGLRIDSSGHPEFILATDTLPDSPGPRDTFDVAVDFIDLRDSLWHLLTATYDGSVMRLSVDGEERVSLRELGVPTHPAGAEFLLGAASGDGARFVGDLDGVLVSPRLRTRNWIRLFHATQRPGASVLSHGPTLE